MTTIYSPINTKERESIDMRAGDTVRVWVKIQEKGKTRLQAFEGLMIARKHGTESGATFTVRKIASGVGVERVFPLYSPVVDKIEVLRRAKVRRSKLYYIREKTAKAIRRKMRGLASFLPTSYKEGDALIEEAVAATEVEVTETPAPEVVAEAPEETVAEEVAVETKEEETPKEAEDEKK